MDDSEYKRANVESFGAAVEAYRDSSLHRAGADLDLLASWCEDADRALDVGCGAGHTAGALADAGFEEVVAADLTRGMVESTLDTFGGPTTGGDDSPDRNPTLAGVLADAERLPFADDAFEAVTSRIAAHHFPDPESFVGEVARVLAPGGVFGFEDKVAPEDDDLAAFMNRLDRVRDPSHVEAHAPSRWTAWLRAAGFAVEESRELSRERDFEAWVDRLDPPDERRERVAELVRRPEAERVYGVTVEDGEVREFRERKALIRARRR